MRSVRTLLKHLLRVYFILLYRWGELNKKKRGKKKEEEEEWKKNYFFSFQYTVYRLIKGKTC